MFLIRSFINNQNITFAYFQFFFLKAEGPVKGTIHHLVTFRLISQFHFYATPENIIFFLIHFPTVQWHNISLKGTVVLILHPATTRNFPSLVSHPRRGTCLQSNSKLSMLLSCYANVCPLHYYLHYYFSFYYFFPNDAQRGPQSANV